MKFCSRFPLLLLFFAIFVPKNLAQMPADSIVEIEKVERYLQQFEKTDTVVPVVVVHDSVEKTITPEVLPKTAENNVSLVEKYLSADDLEQIHRRVARDKTPNSFFVDWVFPIKMAEENFDSYDNAIRSIRQKAQREIVLSAPELFSYHKSQLPKYEDITGIVDEEELVGIAVVDTFTQSIEPIILPLKKPEIWSKFGRFQLQASQNFISSNWYKGGESNLALLTLFDGRINYDNKKNLQWENSLEMRFGFNSAASDTLRKVRMNEDLVKIHSRLNVKAFSSWYYTADVEFSTQLFNTYVANSYERTTAFLSPIRLYGSVGLNYQYKKMVSLLIAPFSYKLTAVVDTTKAAGVSQNIAQKVGIAAGKTTLNEFGSMLKINFKHAFSHEVMLESEFSFYTNYKGIEFDWEIIGNFIINRFLSARVSLRPRYDSTVALPDGEKPKLQFKELISLGFQYRF